MQALGLGNILHGVYVGMIFPSSRLTNSKSRVEVAGFGVRGLEVQGLWLTVGIIIVAYN